MHSATNHRPQGASLEFERCTVPQATISGSTRLYPSWYDVMNFKEIRTDSDAGDALLSAMPDQVKVTIGVTGKIQIPTWFFSTQAKARTLF